MRRYRGSHRELEARGVVNGDKSGRGHLSEESHPHESPSGSALSASPVALALVVLTTVALKVHKLSILGGSWHSLAAAAVIAEDLALFLALFWVLSLIRLAGKASGWHGRTKSAGPPAILLAARASTVILTSIILVFLGVEHLYFCSTKSLLDLDALIVAKRSLGPILFIALQVEGKRGGRVALVIGAALLLTPAAVVITRRGRGTLWPETAVVPLRQAQARLSRCWRTVRWLTGDYAALRGGTAFLAALMALPKVPIGALALVSLVLMSAAVGPGLLGGSVDQSRVKLLRRNCFVSIFLEARSSPSSAQSARWASAVSAAFSSRIIGGLGTDPTGERVKSRLETSPKDASGTARQGTDARNDLEEGSRPNVVIVVLESTSGTLVEASDAAGVSPWAKELASRGMSTSRFYSSMPNTNKAMFQTMCGMTPSLETPWVEFDRPDLLEAVCLPGLLRSKLGYRSLLLTGSMVGGLGVFGHDDAMGYAGEEEQGGRRGFASRQVGEKACWFSFEHGSFSKVNYLGYDDHVVLNRSISFLLGEENAEGGGHPTPNTPVSGGKLLTILTVGPHHYHDVPSDFFPQEFGPWQQQQDSDVSSLRYKYLVALRYQDLFLERLYRQLDDTGLSENTYVVVVGDHGEAFNEHGFDKHGNNVYEEGIIVPFFLTGPLSDHRIVPGKTLDRVGMHADIAPTVLDLLGLWEPQTGITPSSRERPQVELVNRRQEDQDSPRGNANGINQSWSQTNNLRRPKSKPPPGELELPRTAKIEKDGAYPAVGSGLVGDSLLGTDYRSCAISSTHYGGKTLAVVAGDWKGLFMYRWKKRGGRTHAEVANVQLFDLSVDPREKINLVQDAGAGTCCRVGANPRHSDSWHPPTGVLSSACYKATQHPSVPTSSPRAEAQVAGDRMELDRAMVVCCHLETAAVAFASDSLAFFGRQQPK
ncbi:unnamed protein product [Scytosiphon promiscuus]